MIRAIIFQSNQSSGSIPSRHGLDLDISPASRNELQKIGVRGLATLSAATSHKETKERWIKTGERRTEKERQSKKRINAADNPVF